MTHRTHPWARAALVLAAVSLASRALGLVREMVVARAYGASAELDTFWVAFTLPDMLGSVALFVALYLFVPAYLKEREHSVESADQFAAAFLGRATAVLIGLTAACALASPWIISALAPGLSGELRQVALVTAQGTSVVLLARGLDGVLRGVLHAHRQFAVPALAGFGISIGVIGCVLALAPSRGITALTWGTAVGNALPVLFMLPVAWLAIPRLRSWKLTAHPAMARVTRLLPWFVAIEVSGLALPLVDRAVATRALEPGAISALAYARTLSEVPYSLVAMTLATVLFPELAARTAAHDGDGFRRVFQRAVRTVIVLLAPVSLLLFLAPTPLVRGLYERGAFASGETALTASALAAYGVGLLAVGLAAPAIQGAYAGEQVRRLFVVRLIALAVKVVLSVLWVRTWGHVGLALATGAYFAVVALLLIPTLNRGWGRLVPNLKVLLPALAGVAAVSWGGNRAIQTSGLDGSLQLLLALAGVWIAAGGLYLAICRWGRIDEVLEVEGLLRKWLARPRP